MLKYEAFFPADSCAAVVVAAGASSRMGGGEPKQYQTLGGKSVLQWSVETMLQCENIAVVVVVVAPGQKARVAGLLPADDRILLVEGGASRTESVRNGLAALAGRPPTKVLIHDAARPGLSLAVLEELISALDTADAAAPALPMTDAVKSTTTGAVHSIPRDGLVRVQTPQAFRWSAIANAYDNASAAVDDLALVEASGARVVLTPGRPELMKITHAEDLAIVEKLISAPAPHTSAMRIGTGFDVHGFEPGDAVILCGVRIPHTKKLQGHSDADAGWHALTDAILGAAALGDIGDHFPPSDPQWKGANSLVFLKHAVKLAADRGLKVVNADITLLCEKPKIAPHRDAMRVATAEALGIDLSCVSVKATTTEKLGFLGREEGIAAQAVVLLAG
ncbi:MAG: bifunctional 2-C-methyl-D-erythritol 4-phosphate cytidylyltransferase/2-C-methyl-D-erythritol 2,4-cyclodiphosphate synthase [Alphaproteobacteria bacterium]